MTSIAIAKMGEHILRIEKEGNYYNKLQDLARRSYQDIPPNDLRPITTLVDRQGGFTGIGLCRLTSAALIEGTRRKFFPEELVLEMCDINSPEIEVVGIGHNAVRAIDPEDLRERITIDATYRQIRPDHPTVIHVFPTKEEPSAYSMRTIGRTSDQFAIDLERIKVKQGKYPHITMQDYDDLVAIFGGSR